MSAKNPPVMESLLGYSIQDAAAETMSFLQLDGTADAGEAAGTIVYGKLDFAPVLNLLGDRIGEFNDASSLNSSLIFATGVLDSTLEVGFTFHGSLDERLSRTAALLLTDGQWALDYLTGLIVIRKLTAGTSQAITTYKYREQSIDVSLSSPGGAAGDVAHDEVDSGNPVKIGGHATAADRADVGESDRVDASFDLAGHLRTRSKAYNTSSNSDKQTEVAPVYTHHVALLQVEVTNETNATNNRRIDVSGYDKVYFDFINVAGTDSVTLTLNASAHDDGTAIASASYSDISLYGVSPTTQAAGAATYVTDVSGFIDVKGVKFLDFQTVTAGGANDADYDLHVRAAY